MSGLFPEMRMLRIDEKMKFPNSFTDQILVRIGTLGEGSCFVEGTRVYTTSGVKNIEDVKIGDKVVTHTGEIKPVIQLHKNLLDSRQIYNLQIYKTPLIQVTGNHKIYVCKRLKRLTYEGPTWVKVEDLTSDHYVMIPNKKTEQAIQSLDLVQINTKKEDENCNYEYEVKNDKIRRIAYYESTIGNRWDSQEPRKKCRMKKPSKFCNRYWEINPDFCAFLGVWIGDGCCFTRKRKNDTQIKGINIAMHPKNTKLLEFISQIGYKTFGIQPVIHNFTKQNLVQVVFNNVMIGEAFFKLFGKGFDQKRLSSFIYDLDSDCTKSFISGLISSDGCVDQKLNVSLCMSNPNLMEEIYHISRSVGIEASIAYRTSCTGKKTGYIRFMRHNLDIDRIFKVYKDDRMMRLKETFNKISNNCTNFIYFEGQSYLKIITNDVTTLSPNYVYTLGIQDIHSYAVEGILVENCLFHAIARGISTPYRDKCFRERMAFVAALRREMSEKITKEIFLELGGGELAYQKVLSVVRMLIEEYFLSKGILTVEKVDHLIGDVMHEMKPATYDNFKRKFMMVFKDHITEEKEVLNIFDKAENIALVKYKVELANPLFPVSNDIAEFISDVIGVDIYFINSENRLPYLTADKIERVYKDRLSVIILALGNYHYELIGRLTGNKLRTSFAFSDPLIQHLKTLICKK